MRFRLLCLVGLNTPSFVFLYIFVSLSRRSYATFHLFLLWSGSCLADGLVDWLTEGLSNRRADVERDDNQKSSKGIQTTRRSVSSDLGLR